MIGFFTPDWPRSPIWWPTRVRQRGCIDPRRDVDAYLEWSARRGYRIEAILETHVHADFVSVAVEDCNRTGA
ncbi:MAG: hypothetical protein R2839_06995 [Thermomicrobiales bacterium]